jgi:hypothetical protein
MPLRDLWKFRGRPLTICLVTGLAYRCATSRSVFMPSQMRLNRKATNVEADRQCCEIRLRAERKAGKLLLAQQERAERGRPTKTSSRPTLSDYGISRDQSSQW